MVMTMENQYKETTNLSRPKDNSLEAYKVWILTADHRLTQINTRMKFTEAEWVAGWREYWEEGANYFRG